MTNTLNCHPQRATVDREPAHLPVLQRIEVFAALVFIPLTTIGFVSMLIWPARRVRR